MHAEDRAGVAQAIRAALTGDGRYRAEYRIVRPDGAVRWVEARGEVFRDGAGRPARMLGVCSDVTDRKSAEEERSRLLDQEQAARRRAEEAERRVAFLGEIARSISSSLDLDTVLQRIADGANALCRSDTAAIFLRDENTDTLVPRYRVGPWLPACDTLRIRPGEGLGGQVMITGRPLRTGNYRDDPRVPAHLHRLIDETGTVALMVVPIIIGAEVAGILYISNRTERRLSDEDETVCVRDGYEVARRLRSQPETKDIVLIALTGYGQADDRRRSRQAGFDMHLTKPIDPVALGHILATAARADTPAD